MSQCLASPLSALVSYYQRLESDPDEAVAGFGREDSLSDCT
jgi:hypothetical protein